MTKATYRDAVAGLFKARPNTWIEWHEFAAVGGWLAWRTRISDCRRELSMPIENRLERRADGLKVSLYRYVPGDQQTEAA